MKMKNRTYGFTLIELMVTLAILAIVLTVAIPNFSSFQASSRLSAQANDLVTVLNYARVEALKRGSRVSVCKSSSGTSCATGGNWEQGWIVVNVGDGAVLKRHMALSTGYTLVGSANIADLVTFTSTGAPLQNGTFSLCSSAASKSVALSSTGRLSVSDTGASCS
jgi:type IV fimbrial biogenesis protein FimT